MAVIQQLLKLIFLLQIDLLLREVNHTDDGAAAFPLLQFAEVVLNCERVLCIDNLACVVDLTVLVGYPFVGALQLLLPQFGENGDGARHLGNTFELVVANDELVASVAAFTAKAVHEEIRCVVRVVSLVNVADVVQLFASFSDREI